MRQIIFFDGDERQSLLPLTYLRPVAECRVGMLTLREKWLKRLSYDTYGYETADYLSNLFARESREVAEKLYINGAALATDALALKINQLEMGQELRCGDRVIARLTSEEHSAQASSASTLPPIEADATFLTYPEDIIKYTREQFLQDYELTKNERASTAPDTSNRIRGNDLFVGSGVEMYDAIINSTDGPVYLDDEAVIMEGAVIKGPVYIGPKTKIHVGAKVYQDTMLGPQCRIGGEVKRSTMFGYSNKGHDGFLGDSVITSWCNLGADTNNSNLKNTYGHVSLYDIAHGGYRTTDMQFLGMVLGDHTMSAINTSFNTGTVTGVFVNVIDRTPARFMPAFSWGADQVYDVDKAIEVARIVQGRRGIDLSDAYADALRHISRQR